MKSIIRDVVIYIDKNTVNSQINYHSINSFSGIAFEIFLYIFYLK